MKRKEWKGTYKIERELKYILNFIKGQDKVHGRGAHLVIKSHTLNIHTHTEQRNNYYIKPGY